MSRDSFDDLNSDNVESARPEKQGMSTGAKVAIILGIIAGILLLVCCGAGFYFYKMVGNAMTTDPVEITNLRGEIVSSIDIPETYKPQMGMNFSIAGQGMKMTMFGDTTQAGSGSMLMLMQMNVTADEAQMRQQLQQSMGQNQQMNVESSETKTVTIDGAEVDFKFAKGTMNNGGAAMRQVTGVFPGKQGTVMLMLIVPEEKWDEEQALAILQSIKK